MPKSINDLTSVIIVVKNDPEIEDTLKSLIKISHPKINEIIVVDASAGSLKKTQDSFPKVRWINFTPNPNKITIAEQRNVGLRASNGQIIVFIDSGCIPSSDNWLNLLVSPILSEEENIVAGSTSSRNKESIHDQIQLRDKEKKYIEECPTINLAAKKLVFENVGYFDETLEHGEDIDWSWKARDLGYKIRYEEQANVTHDWGTLKQDLVRAFRYGKGRCRLYKNHPKRLKYILSRDPIVVIYPLFILGLPIAIIFPPYLLFLLVPILKNLSLNPVRVTVDHLVYGVGVLAELISI